MIKDIAVIATVYGFRAVRQKLAYDNNIETYNFPSEPLNILKSHYPIKSQQFWRGYLPRHGAARNELRGTRAILIGKRARWHVLGAVFWHDVARTRETCGPHVGCDDAREGERDLKIFEKRARRARKRVSEALISRQRDLDVRSRERTSRRVSDPRIVRGYDRERRSR